MNYRTTKVGTNYRINMRPLDRGDARDERTVCAEGSQESPCSPYRNVERADWYLDVAWFNAATMGDWATTGETSLCQKHTAARIERLTWEYN